MDFWLLVVLAVIQGLTEFLPVSSSAHLLLPSQLLGWQDQGVGVDIAVHAGTLLAALVYLRKELLGQVLSRPVVQSVQSFALHGGYMSVSVLPLIAVTILLQHFIGLSSLRSLTVILGANTLFAILLGLVWWQKKSLQTQGKVFSFNQLENLARPLLILFLLIGVVQAMAIFPGASRSGLVITAGLLLGYSLKSSLHLAFYTSIPAIAGGLVWLTYSAWSGQETIVWFDVVSASLLAFGSGLLAMHLLASLVNRLGLAPFIWYRIALSVLIVVVFLLA